MKATGRLRIAVVTPLFPFPSEPFKGKPIHATVVELQKLAEAVVYCPVATYPGVKWLQPASYEYRRPDLDYRPAGVEKTIYFTYPALPVVSRLLNGYLTGRRLWPLLREFRPDVVLAYWLYPTGFAAVRVARQMGVPVVVGSRGSDLHSVKDPIVRHLTRMCVSGADLVLTVSRDLSRRAVALGAPAERVRTIVNGCDTAVFHPGDRAEARRALGIDDGVRLVVFVGHLIPIKGMHELMEAFRTAAASDPRLELACVGEGSLRGWLAEAARQAGLSGRLRLPGVCSPEGVARWMRAANVFCLPSRQEGCPNVILEALCCDRPVVATEVGGIPELVGPESGCLVRAGDSGALAGALTAALCREWPEGSIAQRFRRGWDRVAGETFEACREAAERKLSRAGTEPGSGRPSPPA